MDRRRKIIGYLVALLAALAQLPAAYTPATAAAPKPRAVRATVFKGRGFDTCEAPPLTTLRAWGTSQYRAVGVYFAGRARACPRQRYLSYDWLTGARDLGWKVLPLFVGSQSPCVKASNKRGFTIGSFPEDQGEDEGDEAVRKASALGIAQGSALYLDMEAYDIKDENCAGTTLAFVQSWTDTVYRRGYVPGFYSSAESGVRHMELARRAGADSLPEIMWFARWKVTPSTDKERSLSAGAWQPHRRIHQYAGDVSETHGGRKLTIDRNLIDAPVAVIE
ncbi:glycoside hydrolase domain-containing protein [Streptomyces orinoci]|uniref:Glycoside hydrolase domain-containing protein n=1 Tax=Streptomyces orinoci TaxID=67339 RepID=A0ABV3K1P7_STRON|nr:glycoside hydrolase domain-containing protein [Streptomyces orinoci]